MSNMTRHYLVACNATINTPIGQLSKVVTRYVTASDVLDSPSKCAGLEQHLADEFTQDTGVPREMVAFNIVNFQLITEHPEKENDDDV